MLPLVSAELYGFEAYDWEPGSPFTELAYLTGLVDRRKSSIWRTGYPKHHSQGTVPEMTRRTYSTFQMKTWVASIYMVAWYEVVGVTTAETV